jgi:hypothetical protein
VAEVRSAPDGRPPLVFLSEQVMVEGEPLFESSSLILEMVWVAVGENVCPSHPLAKIGLLESLPVL